MDEVDTGSWVDQMDNGYSIDPYCSDLDPFDNEYWDCIAWHAFN
jgi:hypothetical protein